MFDIGPLEFLVLALAALFIFGPERLPEAAAKAGKMLRQVRNMATNARSELSNELGPEFANLSLEDLNPRTFIRKNLIEGTGLDTLQEDIGITRDHLDLGLDGATTAEDDTADPLDFWKRPSIDLDAT
jgi:sec-independent protein translocase protein TatB